MAENEKKPVTVGKVFLISILSSLFMSIIITIALFNIGIPKFTEIFNKPVEVDDIRNAKLDLAKLVVERKGLLLSVAGEEENAEVPKGNIIRQEPLPGSMVKKGTTINVTTSKGVETIELPNLNMLPVEEAKNQITKLGLGIGQVTPTFSETVPDNHVISSDPQAGAKLEKGKIVNLVISSGKKKVRVPSLWGLSITDATSALQKKGLKLGAVKKTTNIKKKFDIILEQSPAADSMVADGSEVGITVNAEEEGGDDEEAPAGK